MRIVFKNEKLTIEEIRSGIFKENIFTDHELQVINFVNKWFSPDDFIEFVTSGSTGVPKVIKLMKSQIMHSAESTMKFIDSKNQIKQCVLCISPGYIGGAMLIMRALLRKLDLIVLKANGLPSIADYENALISMVPLQVINALEQDESILDNAHTILIGGAQLPQKFIKQLRSRNINAYTTYGMTETASHIALRHISAEHSYFKTLPDIQIQTDDRACLKIKGAVTNNQWFQTNDMVNLIDEKTFEWLGRADFMINSGGHKVNPERLEEIVRQHIQSPVLVVPEKDALLGQKVVMLIESSEEVTLADEIFNHIHPYERPKRIHFVDDFIYTANGKIDRIQTANKYIK